MGKALRTLLLHPAGLHRRGETKQTNINISNYGSWDLGLAGTYPPVHDAANGVWAGGANPYAQNSYQLPGDIYVVARGIMAVSLVTIPVGACIIDAPLKCDVSTVWATHTDFAAVLVDGTGIARNNSGYGQMLGRTISLGSYTFYHPLPITTQPITIPLNSLGIALLQANIGGTAHFGLRLSTDINNIAPGYGETANERQEFVVAVLAGAVYFSITYTT